MYVRSTDGLPDCSSRNLPIDWMNDLQHLPEKDHGPVLVTLNPPFEPQSDLIAGKYRYEHPVLDSAVRSNSKDGRSVFSHRFLLCLPERQAINAQKEMPTIQNVRGISFAGAWMKYGFHEDGFTTGLRAATGIIQNTPHLESKHTILRAFSPRSVWWPNL